MPLFLLKLFLLLIISIITCLKMLKLPVEEKGEIPKWKVDAAIRAIADEMNREFSEELRTMTKDGSEMQLALNMLRRRYSHTGGWSPDREFRHLYSIPPKYWAAAQAIFGDDELLNNAKLRKEIFDPFFRVAPPDKKNNSDAVGITVIHKSKKK